MTTENKIIILRYTLGFLLGLFSMAIFVGVYHDNISFNPSINQGYSNFNGQNYSSVIVKEFNIVYMPKDKINELWKSKNVTKYGNKTIGAFNDPKNRVIYISLTDKKDINGKSMPDFCTLGHEVLHFNELNGAWHN